MVLPIILTLTVLVFLFNFVANNVTAARSGKLYLCHIKPFIIKIFDIMRISKHLSIFETEEQALDAVKQA